MRRKRQNSSSNNQFLIPIGLVVLAVLLWSVTRSGVFATGPASEVQLVSPAVAIVAPPLPVTDYLRYTSERSAGDAGRAHGYSADGFRLLADALESLNGAVETALSADEIRALADSLQQDGAAPAHARQAREAALAASAILGKMPEASQPALHDRAMQVNDVADGIDGDQPLLEQISAVQRFFAVSADFIGEISK